MIIIENKLSGLSKTIMMKDYTASEIAGIISFYENNLNFNVYKS
jgi:hypothetical protein